MSIEAREHCPLCGQIMVPRYVLSSLLMNRLPVDPPMGVFWCTGCDAGFLMPRPSPQQLERLYDESYFGNYKNNRSNGRLRFVDRLRIAAACRFDKAAHFSPSMIESLLGTKSATVCELGCGNGDILRELEAHGFSTFGVEPDPVAVENARSKGFEVAQGTAEELPSELSGAQFDAVVMFNVLEHCHDPILASKNALRLLRPGGCLVIVVPNCGSFQFERRGMTWYHADPGRHVNYFTRRSLEKLFSKHEVHPPRFFFYRYVDHFLNEHLACEAEAWESMEEGPDRANLRGLRRASRLGAMWELARSSTLRPERKYEMLGGIIRVD